MIQLNAIPSNEHPVPHLFSVNVSLKKNNGEYKIIDADQLDGANIIGLFIRQQNAAGSRKSSMGASLCNNTALASGFIKFIQESTDVMDKIPLEFLVHDQMIHKPGSYAHIVLPKGFSISKSRVSFSDSSALVDNEELELNFIYLPANCVF